ncbi:WAT1-related protein At3g02690, chloroplastic isoform X3 [Ricinus communis]|uniref:WAT1-related protein At3g02690, chloroplastic isoform X3 n=1 Tax=Ricinus communis TaxID=3988 RepID=UPI0007728E07|nr:WAT1-related protein At3g02690, chloroplastic isoform X3 [Ricinus communis]|eukprot:XP_015581711.1 WAT1-related protein At3g02690, chloroplastic isoform X2 [Ricinus communis]
MKLLSPSLPNNLSVKFSLLHISPPPYNRLFKYPSPISSHTITDSTRTTRRRPNFIANCTTSSRNVGLESTSSDSTDLDCVGTGLDVECLISSESSSNGTMSSTETTAVEQGREERESKRDDLLEMVVENGVLVSPFFFWGTAMVAMKEVLPLTGPFFVAAFRLIPAGLILIAFAAYKDRPFPSGFNAWLSIFLFGLVDATFFQGFLAEGLQRTSAGLGSVIIDSQPLTVAVLAALLFGESIGLVGAGGLVLGVVGLLLLEHMVIGGLPLTVISILNHDPLFNGSLQELTVSDIAALLYTSIFGSAISYGVFFYSATKGSLTKLSSLTFLTPMFASIFGFLYLGETFSPLQLFGAAVTLVAIYMVNYRSSME